MVVVVEGWGGEVFFVFMFWKGKYFFIFIIIIMGREKVRNSFKDISYF